MIKLHKADVPHVLDWMKTLLAIDSAAIAALVFASRSSSYEPGVKIAIVLFTLSLLLLLSGFLAVAEHGRAPTNFMARKASSVVFGGFAAFLCALLSLVLSVVVP